MGCDEFLQGYSDFVDGRLQPPSHASFEAHLEGCEACARYHRVVQRGLFIYRNLPELQPSSDFLPRLRHRLHHVDDRERLAGGTPVGSAALVAVAAVGFLALAWLPFATRLSVEVELPPVAVEAPPGEAGPPSLFSRGPFIAPRTGHVSPVGAMTVPAGGWDIPMSSASWGLVPAVDGWADRDAYPALFERASLQPAPSSSAPPSSR